MRILVTNDDGVESAGLHRLARALRPFAEVVVVAPDTEFSGASCAVGALGKLNLEIQRVQIEGVDEAWTVSGTPALCVLLAGWGVFEKDFDLVVSGINPGANVGRSIYHSGTFGAALTARNFGMTGVAVSIELGIGGSVMGQNITAAAPVVEWDTAARVAAHAVGALALNPPREAMCLNINVPNVGVDELRGWRRTELAHPAGRVGTEMALHPKPGHENVFTVSMDWGEPADLPEHTDVGALQRGFVSLTWVSRFLSVDPGEDHPAEVAVERLFRV
jgi:5'-nucleotidase